jgi:hypothetical protein
LFEVEVDELEARDPSIHSCSQYLKKKKRFRSFCTPEELSLKNKKKCEENHKITKKSRTKENNFGVVVVWWW